MSCDSQITQWVSETVAVGGNPPFIVLLEGSPREYYELKKIDPKDTVGLSIVDYKAKVEATAPMGRHHFHCRRCGDAFLFIREKDLTRFQCPWCQEPVKHYIHLRPIP